MNDQLDLFPLNHAELKKELKDREGSFWLFMVYFPKDQYYRPDVTQAQRDKAEAEGKKAIPQEKWDDCDEECRAGCRYTRDTGRHWKVNPQQRGASRGARPSFQKEITCRRYPSNPKH